MALNLSQKTKKTFLVFTVFIFYMAGYCIAYPRVPRAVVYLSDHATSKKNNKMEFNNCKDQTKIPFYIWYSDKIQGTERKTGSSDELTQTTILYSIVTQLMGVEFKQKDTHDYHNHLRFVNADLTVTDYDKVPD